MALIVPFYCEQYFIVIGNSGFFPGSQNSVQLERRASSRARAAAVADRPWPELLNPRRSAHFPQGLPDPGQGEQTPRLNLELDSPRPRQRARCSLASPHPPPVFCVSSRPLPRVCAGPPHLHTGLGLCCNTGPIPGARLGSTSAELSTVSF